MSRSSQPRVLLLEDERALADTLLLSLQKLKYECVWTKTLAEARTVLKDPNPFALWILDRNLPDGDGISLLNHAKREQSRVLILSAKSEIADRVKGLKSGADDYLSKPFSFAELSARLEVLLRRPVERAPSAPTRSGTGEAESLWTLREEKLQVLAPTGWVELTPLEFKFLKYLIERAGDIVSKDRLLKDVWGFTFLPKTRTVDYVLTQLRKRLELEPDSPAHLLTVRGAGIRFIKSGTPSGR